MKPVALTTARLVLDQPTMDDADLVTEYCQDPLFETFLTTPVPYRRGDAERFIGRLVPEWWADGNEYTWAIRLDGVLIGIVGYRTRGRDVGFWLGADYRGRGYMPEAVAAVADWVFTLTDSAIEWECLVGNLASAATARKTGFTFGGTAPARISGRDGSVPLAWKGTLAKTDPRDPKPGWPLPSGWPQN